MIDTSLFTHFDRICDAPGATSKLRESVLELAFCGRLFEHSVEWPLKTVAEVASDISPGFACAKTHQVEDGFVHLRTHNIGTNGRLNFDLIIRVDPDKIDVKKAGLKKGDIIFNNTNSQELVGKTCLVDRDCDYAFSNHLTRIKLHKEVDPNFFVAYFMLLLKRGFFSRLCNRWIGQAGINLGSLKTVALPVPSLAEQRQVVAKLDELMALCDRLEVAQAERERRRDRLAAASLNRLNNPDDDASTFRDHAHFHLRHLSRLTTRPEQMSQLRRAILSLAMLGKLVPQDPSEMHSEIADRNTKRSHATQISLDEIPFTLPDKWRWSRLGSVAALINGDRGKNYPNREEYVASGLPFINTGHIQPDGSLSMEFMHYITREKFNSLGGGKIKPGDLVYCLRGATLGKTAFVEPFVEGAIASSLMIIRLDEIIDNKFMYYYLLSPLGRQQIARFDNGTAQPNLSSASVKLYVIPVPPLAEQHRIVAKVNELMSICDQLEAQLTTAQTESRRLLEAILHEALAPAVAVS